MDFDFCLCFFFSHLISILLCIGERPCPSSSPRERNKIGKVNGLKCPAGWAAFLIGFCICFLESPRRNTSRSLEIGPFFGAGRALLNASRSRWIYICLLVGGLDLDFQGRPWYPLTMYPVYHRRFAHIASIIDHISSLFACVLYLQVTRESRESLFAFIYARRVYYRMTR